MKLKVILLIGLLILGIGVISSKVIVLNCYEKDPLIKLDIKLNYLMGNLNPFPQDVQPFSKEGLQYAIKFNDFKKNCLDKW